MGRHRPAESPTYFVQQDRLILLYCGHEYTDMPMFSEGIL